MKEALSCHGPFEKFLNDTKRRDDLLVDLATIVSDSYRELLVLASPLDTATQETFNRLTVEQKKSLGGNPYDAAFEACILGALDQSPAELRLQVVCDLAEDYSKECVKAFSKMRMINSEIKAKTLGICFSDDTWNPPLQIADMLAYCERSKFLEQKRNQPPSKPVVSQLMELLKPGMPSHVLCHTSSRADLGGSGYGELE